MEFLLIALSFGTLAGVAAFAYLGAKATEKLKDDPTHVPSTLCAKSGQWSSLGAGKNA